MNVKRLTRTAIACVALVGASAVAASPASVAHCTDNGGPGNSDFAAHVRANNGSGEHNEGDHQGWSSCEPQARSGGRG